MNSIGWANHLGEILITESKCVYTGLSRFHHE